MPKKKKKIEEVPVTSAEVETFVADINAPKEGQRGRFSKRGWRKVG